MANVPTPSQSDLIADALRFCGFAHEAQTMWRHSEEIGDPDRAELARRRAELEIAKAQVHATLAVAVGPDPFIAEPHDPYPFRTLANGDPIPADPTETQTADVIEAAREWAWRYVNGEPSTGPTDAEIRHRLCLAVERYNQSQHTTTETPT